MNTVIGAKGTGLALQAICSPAHALNCGGLKIGEGQ